jgi:hypothetical protein
VILQSDCYSLIYAGLSMRLMGSIKLKRDLKFASPNGT